MTLGFWDFPETIDSCSRCGARRPATVDYTCRVLVGWRDDGSDYCGAPAVALILPRNEPRCARHAAAVIDTATLAIPCRHCGFRGGHPDWCPAMRRAPRRKAIRS